VDPPNPKPGQETTITGIVQNLGDVSATSISVEFYDGDPAGSGVLIDTAIVAGPLDGGEEVEASVAWVPPTSTQSHDIYMYVDPTGQEDIQTADNTATLPGVMKQDLLIDSILGQNAGLNDRIVTVRVLNDGGLTVAGGYDLELRQGSETGTVLVTLNPTYDLVPGAYCDVSWTWEDAAPFTGGSEKVYVALDVSGLIDEFSESNNVGSVTLFNTSCSADANRDGFVNIDDFVIVLTTPWGACPGCQADLDYDGDVDVDDFVIVLTSPWGPCS